MKKEKTPLVSIQPKTVQPVTAWQHAVLFLCRFFLLRFCFFGLSAFFLIHPLQALELRSFCSVDSCILTLFYHSPKYS